MEDDGRPAMFWPYTTGQRRVKKYMQSRKSRNKARSTVSNFTTGVAQFVSESNEA
jgi:hypothetical protein